MSNKIIYSIALSVVLGSASMALGQNGGRPPGNTPTPKPPAPTTPANPNQPADSSKEDRQRQRQEERQAERDKQGLPASFYKVSELNGLVVDAKGGEKIGEVRNIAINADNGRTRYAIVDNGSGTLYPIPMPAMKFAKGRGHAMVDTTPDRMKSVTVFKPEGWNTIGDAKWGKIVYDFYGLQRTPEDDKDRPDFTPANAMVGAKVETRKGDGLGAIKDIMIDTEKNGVAYGVMEFGKEGKLFALPWEAMTVNDSGKRVVVRGIDRDDLKDAPGFPNSRWPNYKDLGWNKDTNFDSKPPTWIYGYKEVGGGGGGNGGGSGNGSGDRGAMGGWQTNSKYSEMFRPKAVEHWKGTIVRTDSVTPLSGMDPGTALIVKVEGQGNITVHLGPEWFVRHQQDKFAENDAIEVVGSKVDIDQKPVIMATQIRMQGRTMFLRNAEGVPAWDAWQERK